jgi:hypothetical protein
VDIVRPKQCPQIIASITMSARVVVWFYTPSMVTAVSTVPLAQCHARQFKKHARRAMIQLPAVIINVRFWQ